MLIVRGGGLSLSLLLLLLSPELRPQFCKLEFSDQEYQENQEFTWFWAKRAFLRRLPVLTHGCPGPGIPGIPGKAGSCMVWGQRYVFRRLRVLTHGCPRPGKPGTPGKQGHYQVCHARHGGLRTPSDFALVESAHLFTPIRDCEKSIG